jgi:hypothetical protein
MAIDPSMMSGGGAPGASPMGAGPGAAAPSGGAATPIPVPIPVPTPKKKRRRGGKKTPRKAAKRRKG